jgi:hypothetical protein
VPFREGKQFADIVQLPAPWPPAENERPMLMESTEFEIMFDDWYRFASRVETAFAANCRYARGLGSRLHSFRGGSFATRWG